MASWWYLFRFFRVVAPVPALTRTTFVVLAVGACAKIAVDPAESASALLPIVVLQAFATSSGFVVPARRGYYDLVLTRADGRLRVAVAQWVASAWPGVAAWAAVAAIEAIVSGGSATASRAAGTVLAMLIVSTVPWAITVPLPRFSGAIGWLLLLVTLSSFVDGRRLADLWNTRGPVGGVVLTGVRDVVFPLGLIGRAIGASTVHAMPGLLVCALAMACAFAWIDRCDLALEAAQ